MSFGIKVCGTHTGTYKSTRLDLLVVLATVTFGCGRDEAPKRKPSLTSPPTAGESQKSLAPHFAKRKPKVRVLTRAPGVDHYIRCIGALEEKTMPGMPGLRTSDQTLVVVSDPTDAPRLARSIVELPITEDGALALTFDAPVGTRIELRGESRVIDSSGPNRPVIVDLRGELGDIELSAIDERARDSDPTPVSTARIPNPDTTLGGPRVLWDDTPVFAVPIRVTSADGVEVRAAIEIDRLCLRNWIQFVFGKAAGRPVSLGAGDEPTRTHAGVELDLDPSHWGDLTLFHGRGRVRDISVVFGTYDRRRSANSCGYVKQFLVDKEYIAYNRRSGKEIERKRFAAKPHCPDFVSHSEGKPPEVTNYADVNEAVVKNWAKHVIARSR